MNSIPSNIIRAASISFEGSNPFDLPCYYPSISSVKTNLSPIEYLRILVTLKHPCFLISAYDIFHAGELIQNEMKQLIGRAIRNGAAVLFDSGNYESYWHRDEDWSCDKFITVLETVDLVPSFGFDIQQPFKEKDVIVEQIKTRVLSEQKTGHYIIPIIHANDSDIEAIATGILEQLSLKMIAVPERLLGDGIIQRAKSVARIREALNCCGHYVPIHLLGTGNPLSILLYVMCGADCFDGLEWCQTTVDHTTALLYHFQQRELFGKQNEFCEMPDFPYAQATLAHNLLFYRNWMEEIRLSLSDGSIFDTAKKYFSRDLFSELERDFDL